MRTETIYHTPVATTVKIKDYKFRRLSRDKTYWEAWNTGQLEDKSRTKVIYKLTSALMWARFTKDEIRHLLMSWHRKHGWCCNSAQLTLIYIAVKDWMKLRLRERKRLEMQRYRARLRMRKALDALASKVMGDDHK